MDEDSAIARHCGSVQLSEVAPILANSRRLRADLARHFGKVKSAHALGLLASGRLTGRLGDELQDFLADKIVNDAMPAWHGYTFDPNNPSDGDRHFPVRVMEYEGVYFVFALELDNVGYFTSLEDAKSYVAFEHENLEELALPGHCNRGNA